MGQDLFYEPSVFSYFRPLLRIPADQLRLIPDYSTPKPRPSGPCSLTPRCTASWTKAPRHLTPFVEPGSDCPLRIRELVFLHSTIAPG